MFFDPSHYEIDSSVGRSTAQPVGHVPTASVSNKLQFLLKSVPLVIPIPYRTANPNTHVTAATIPLPRVVSSFRNTFYSLKVTP